VPRNQRNKNYWVCLNWTRPGRSSTRGLSRTIVRALIGPSVTGRNFYEEVAPFDKVEELRQRIGQFRQGTSPAEHFNFDCRYSDGALLVRVLLTRLNERANDERAPSILMHIRKVA
jgi:hypothetical protein